MQMQVMNSFNISVLPYCGHKCIYYKILSNCLLNYYTDISIIHPLPPKSDVLPIISSISKNFFLLWNNSRRVKAEKHGVYVFFINIR